MALDHVCMWKEKKGWQHIELEELKRDHPVGGISAKSKLLLCDLCDQHVTFVNTPNRQYFMHGDYKADKNCKERSTSEKRNFETLSFRTLTLPLKLKFMYGTFDFQLGLLPLPDDVLQKCINAQFYISASNNTFTYSFAERLQTGKITFLSVGHQPCEKYRLSSDTLYQKAINKFWPQETQGIYPKGTLFDGKTGRRILVHASVQMNHRYLLLIRRGHLAKAEGVITTFQDDLPGGWQVYSVRATKFAKEVDEFFLNYHVRLQTEAAQVKPLWPPCTVCSDIMHTPSNRVITFALLGNSDLEVRAFPTQVINPYSNVSPEYRLFDFQFSGRQQLIFIGISQMIDYLYLWEDPLSQVNQDIPQVIVQDEADKELLQDVYSVLPPNGRLFIQPKFDGQAVLVINNFVRLKVELKAGEKASLVVHLGDTLRISQGCDCIRAIMFQQKSSFLSSIEKDDHRLAMRLMAYSDSGDVDVPRPLLGAAAAKLSNCSETRRVLYRFAKRGSMPLKAYWFLKKYLSST